MSADRSVGRMLLVLLLQTGDSTEAPECSNVVSHWCWDACFLTSLMRDAYCLVLCCSAANAMLTHSCKDQKLPLGPCWRKADTISLNKTSAKWQGFIMRWAVIQSSTAYMCVLILRKCNLSGLEVEFSKT